MACLRANGAGVMHGVLIRREQSCESFSTRPMSEMPSGCGDATIDQQAGA